MANLLDEMNTTELENGRDFHELFKKMRVSDNKTELIGKILKAQEGIYQKTPDNADFFVFIPFCTSRCKYCSFVTTDISKTGKYVDEYVSCLVEEIGEAKKIFPAPRSYYIGGGTPVSLPYNQLKRVLEAIGKVDGVEYTVVSQSDILAIIE